MAQLHAGARTPVISAGDLARATAAPARSWLAALLRRLLLHGASLAIAAAAFAAHEHFKQHGASTESLASLGAVAVFGLSPLRALLRELLALEGKVLHLAHGLGGLTLVGLSLGGVVSGRPVLDHAALAPFALMGAAQAITHQGRPRTPEQAEALRRFASSLPEVQRLARTGDLGSPANVRRTVAVLGDLVAKAQALGETELRSDPAFQGALTRLGLTLGLDSVDAALDRIGADPAVAGAVPDLRRRLAKARATVARR